LSPCDCHNQTKAIAQRKVLFTLLLINGVMFVIEFGVGLYAQSTGLIADSVDMLADASVYGIAILAVGQGTLAKARAAHISGVIQVLLAFGVIVDVVRRFLLGSEPHSTLMLLMGFAALLANLACLALLARHRKGEVHMRASWVFSRNDVLANLGVMIGGALVAAFHSPLPDLLIGAAIAAMVMHGGISIIRSAKQAASE